MTRTPAADATIFVAIPCYRDKELLPTLRSLLEAATEPGRVSIGICLQIDQERDLEDFRGLAQIPRMRVRCFDARSAPGLGWARSEAHALRRHENYVLQIDSHMRFHPGWDVTLIECLAACPSERPVLSTHPAPYRPDDPSWPRQCETRALSGVRFAANGMAMLRARQGSCEAPTLSYFLAGGFVFASSCFFNEVPHDPRIAFNGEELGYSLRAFTHGWEAFAPHRCVVHHYYNRQNAPRYTDDHPEWYRHEMISMLRLHHLLGSRVPLACDITAGLDGRYGLGGRRSRREFELLANLDLSSFTTRASNSTVMIRDERPNGVNDEHNQ